MSDDLAAAAHALHAKHGDSARFAPPATLGFEAAEGGVETIQRHLHGVERKVVREHSQMNAGILVTCESDEANLALLLCLDECFGCTVGAKIKSGSL